MTYDFIYSHTPSQNFVTQMLVHGFLGFLPEYDIMLLADGCFVLFCCALAAERIFNVMLIVRLKCLSLGLSTE